MRKTKRELTESAILEANNDLDGTAMLFVVAGNDNIDLLEISKDWMKFKSKKGEKSTFLIQRDEYVQLASDALMLVSSKKPEIEQHIKDKLGINVLVNDSFVEQIGDVSSALEQWWDSLVEKILNLNGIASLLGPFKDLERGITAPRDILTGYPVDESGLKIINYGKSYLFFIKTLDKTVNDNAEVWRVCFAPIIAYGKKISAEIKPLNENDVSLQLPQHGLKYLLDKSSTLDLFEVDMSEEPIDEVESAGSACAERRMKLFNAAKHYGADIFRKSGWIAAVCWTYEQCHVFGRLKPKVKPGTNEIDPDCNLEDWEGITPENKAKRDDWSLPWIKDGIDDKHGKLFDHLSGESGQPKKSFGCETAWCNCGVLNGDGTWKARDKSNRYFDFYNNGGKTPYLILMDLSRGALYQYVHMKNYGDVINFLNEDDKVDGGRIGNPPDAAQMVFFKEFCEENPKFAEFISELDAQFY